MAPYREEEPHAPRRKLVNREGNLQRASQGDSFFTLENLVISSVIRLSHFIHGN